jgi:hypothetical protein
MAVLRTVFLSSTGRDLRAYREAAYRAIHGLDGYHCVRMEDFGARDWEVDEFCRAKVAACDLFVGIIGHVYGDHPDHSEQSFTEREFEAAAAASKPRLMFIAPDDFPLASNLIEPDAVRAKQQSFRERVNKERVRDTFTTPDDLTSRVVRAIRNWEQEAPLEGMRRSPRRVPAWPLEYFKALRRTIEMAPFVSPPSSASLQRPEVESVWVPVYVQTFGLERELLRESATQDRRVYFSEAWNRWRPEHDGPMVILGGPGSGKTTLLKHVGLGAIDAAVGVTRPNADLQFPTELLPVFVRCADLKIRTPRAARVIAGQPPQVDLGMSEAVFHAALRDGRCLLLLDGLDEAPDAKQMAQLSRWVEKLYNSFPKVRIVLSSRSASYRGDAVLRLKHHRTLNLAPMEGPEIRRFLDRWYGTIEPDAAKAAVLAEGLTKVLEDPAREDLKRLAVTPLMLLIMAFVHRSGQGLPERRVDLYNLCVDILLEHWNKENERRYIPASLGRTILRPVAFWMQLQPERRSASTTDLVPLIKPELERTPRLPERDPVAFLNLLRDCSTGLFTGISQDDFSFQHLTFQEFLAAEHVKTEPDQPAPGAAGRS